MNKKIAMRWAKALESGKYKKTRNTLEDANGFCCLGVLCKLAQKEGVQPQCDDYSRLEGQRLSDQKRVRYWAGLNTDNGEFSCRPPRINGIAKDSLVVLNDLGWSFKKIAAFIRKNWASL